MNLPDILKGRGEFVWAFTRYTNLTTIADAHRRVQSKIARPPYDKVRVSVTSVILTDTKTYESEPALVILVEDKGSPRKR